MNEPDALLRKVQVHSELDQIFSATCDLERLPALISEIGCRHVACEFISMWLYEPTDHSVVNLLAREHVGDESPDEPDLPRGKVRIQVGRGPGRGVLANLTAAVLEGEHLDQMPDEAYIVNDRGTDPRISQHLENLDLTHIRGEMYAPMAFNGFKGMVCALNHRNDHFSRDDFEVLRIIAVKAAVFVDTLEARRRADEASRLATLGRSVDMVRHELMSPLAAIKGAARVAAGLLRRPQREDRIPTVLELTDLIVHEVDRNIRMLDDIREYCRPHLQLSLQEACVNTFLQSSLSALQTVTGRTPGDQIQIHLAPGDHLPPALLSPDHLLAVLRNVVRNSAERRCARIRIETGQETGALDGRVLVTISVQDSGGGLDEKRLDHLFHPYETTRGAAGGSGLGLYICRRLIEEGHGGRITARNLYHGEARLGLAIDIAIPAACQGTPPRPVATPAS